MLINVKIHLFRSTALTSFLGNKENLHLLSGDLVQIFESLLTQEKSTHNPHIFIRKLLGTSPLGCRQVICSIRLAGLSFWKTNSTICFLPLTPCYIQTFQ